MSHDMGPRVEDICLFQSLQTFAILKFWPYIADFVATLLGNRRCHGND